MRARDPTPSDDRIVAPRSRLRVGLGASVVLVLIGLAVAVLVSAFGAAGASRTIAPERSAAVSDSSAEQEAIDPAATGPPGATIFVHILGSVARPGLYELRDGDRVVDAVSAAAGFTDAADQSAINLARRLVDGEQVYVPVVGEVPPPAATGGSAASDPQAPEEKVNLNTADEEALDTLPGIGPATAADILSWREENGRFTAIEDLLSIDGIGEKTFDRLKDLVVV